jgi:WD40 repeat protein
MQSIAKVGRNLTQSIPNWYLSRVKSTQQTKTVAATQSPKSILRIMRKSLEALQSLPLPEDILSDPKPIIQKTMLVISQALRAPKNPKKITQLMQLMSEILDSVSDLNFLSFKDAQNLSVLLVGVQLMDTAARQDPKFAQLAQTLKKLAGQPKFKELLKNSDIKQNAETLLEMLDKETPALATVSFSDDELIHTLSAATKSDSDIEVEDSSSDDEIESSDNEVCEELEKWHNEALLIKTRSIAGVRATHNQGSNTFTFAEPTDLKQRDVRITDLRFFAGYGIAPILGIGFEDSKAVFVKLLASKRLVQVQEISFSVNPIVATHAFGQYFAATNGSSVIVRKQFFDDRAFSAALPLLSEHLPQGHIYDIELYHDYLFVAFNNTILVWDLVSKKQIREFIGHKEPIISIIAVGPYLITGSQDDSVRIWNIEEGVCVKRLSGHRSDVTALVVNENRILISGDENGQIRTWNGAFKSRKKIHRGLIQDLSMKGNFVASCAEDNGVRIWDFKKSRELYKLKEKAERLHLFRNLKNQYLMATASNDGAIRLWQLQRSKPILINEWGV